MKDSLQHPNANQVKPRNKQNQLKVLKTVSTYIITTVKLQIAREWNLTMSLRLREKLLQSRMKFIYEQIFAKI